MSFDESFEIIRSSSKSAFEAALARCCLRSDVTLERRGREEAKAGFMGTGPLAKFEL